VQAGVGQLHLRLDANGSRDMPAGDPFGQIVQQRALAYTGLTPKDGGPAPAGESIGQEPVERLTLVSASDEFCGLAGLLTRWRPPLRIS
jgi:hypothetical protein